MIRRNCIFLLDKEKDKPDAKLRYRIKWEGNTVAFNVGFRVDIDKWSTEAQRCKSNTTHGKKKVHSSIINREINRFEQLAEQVFYTFEQNNEVPTVVQFRDEFNKLNGKTGKTEEPSFFECYTQFILEGSRELHWSENTVKHHVTVRNHVKAFAPEIEFEDWDEKGLQAFVDYMLNTANLRNDTAAKDLKILKWFLKWAVEKGYMKDLSFQSFSPHFKTVAKTVVFLSWDELMKVYNFPIPENKEYLRTVRDVFCFCCFTSLRYSDVLNLKRSNITDSHIRIVSTKTTDNLSIELNKYSKTILDRYKNIDFPENKALPVISNQKMNKHLKELGRMCELNTPVETVYYKGSKRIEETVPKYELMCTHVGRRTFICNALMMGIAPNIVMKWTGHNDYNAMKPYIDIADKVKMDAMKLFDR